MDIGAVVHAFFDNAGPGGVFALLVVGTACAIYYFLTRWIVAPGRQEKPAAPEEKLESLDS